jgi:hypothetical protein
VHGEDISGQSPHGEDYPGEDVLREIGRNTERLFHTVQCRFHAEKDVEAGRYPQTAAAEITAVCAGRKPLYHEHLLPEEAESLADILRFLVPASVTVEAREGHLVAYRAELVTRIIQSDRKFYRPHHESIPAALWRVVRQGAMGELLGYGLRTLNAPNHRRVLIADGTHVLTGFQAPAASAERFAAERAFDYAFHLGRAVTVVID